MIDEDSKILTLARIGITQRFHGPGTILAAVVRRYMYVKPGSRRGTCAESRVVVRFGTDFFVVGPGDVE